MAVSAEGYVSRRSSDDMVWTGQTDKSVFRALTHVGGGVIGAGSKTFRLLPSLRGRTVVEITRTPMLRSSTCMTLGEFEASHPDGWLVGGQTIALEALKLRYVDEVFLCRTGRACFPTNGGQKERLTDALLEVDNGRRAYSAHDEFRVHDAVVEVWRLDPLMRRRPYYPPLL